MLTHYKDNVSISICYILVLTAELFYEYTCIFFFSLYMFSSAILSLIIKIFCTFVNDRVKYELTNGSKTRVGV